MKKLVPTLLSLAIPFLASAETYHVTSTGNDLNPGTEAQPFREIRAALAVVGAGDTILVGNGQYKGFDAKDLMGTVNAPILIKATGNNAEVLPTTDRTDNRDTIHIVNCRYLILDGFRSANANRAAVRVDICDHVTVRNGVFANNARWGIFTNHCDDLVLENNSASGSQIEHGIYVSNSGDRPIVRGNTLFNNHANGLHMNGDLSAGGGGASDGDGVITGALVEKNIIYNNGTGGGSGINCDGVRNSIIRNNLLYNCRASGISLYQIDGGGPSTGNVVVNNTVIVAAGTGRWCLNIRDGGTGNTAVNNIFYNLHDYRGSISISADSLSGASSDYNVVMSRFTTNDGDSVLTLEQWRTATGFDTHSIVATPAQLFVNASANDYHLNATSTAANVGQAAHAPDDDIEGTARPGGSGYDIGAYERPGNDTTPPQIIGRSPVPGATGVAAGITLSARFSESITPGSLAFVLRNPAGGVVPAALSYNAAAKTALLNPAADLAAGTTYTAALTAAADLAGNALASPVSWSFTTAKASANAFVETGGFVLFEAEHFDGSINRFKRAWRQISSSGALGAAMVAAPEKNTTLLRGFTRKGPELQFRVLFRTPGKYYIWLRGYAKTEDDRISHLGLDGRASSASSRIILPRLRKWHWANGAAKGPAAYIRVDTPGVHVVNLWMGDDGVRLDRILLTTNRGFKPQGLGPGESARD